MMVHLGIAPVRDSAYNCREMPKRIYHAGIRPEVVAPPCVRGTAQCPTSSVGEGKSFCKGVFFFSMATVGSRWQSFLFRVRSTFYLPKKPSSSKSRDGSSGL